MCERINLSNLPSHHQMVERLVDSYNNACQYEKITGLTWYSDAFQYAARLHVEYGYSIRQVIELISVISPGARWESVNMQLPERMVSYHNAGMHLTDYEWNVYPSSVKKAQAILDGIRNQLKGNKVSNFANAIEGDYNSVVIDGWMVKLVYANPGLYWKNTAVSSDGMYNRISDAVRDAAMYVGVQPALLQAVTWVSYRNEWTGKARRYRKNQEEKQFLAAMIDKVGV